MRSVIILFISLVAFSSYGQKEKRTLNRSMSVDGTYLLSFLKTEEVRITPFNLHVQLKDKLNLRTGFNINNSTSSNKGFTGDLKIGAEYVEKYSEKWSYYYGVDLNCAYSNYNDRDNTILILSAMPFFGFEVLLGDEFSLSYEPKIIFNHYKYQDPDSIAEKISYEDEIKLTGLSQFYINFNF